jgi:hypothetical protein
MIPSHIERMEALIPDHSRAHILSGMALLRWSPRIWGALHGLSFLYPMADLSPLLGVLAKTMPCGVCAHHVSQYLDQHPICRDGPEQYRWFHYLLDFHNDVNLRTAKPIHPIHDALPAYQRTFAQNPTHFRASVHNRFWQTLWLILATEDLSGTHTSTDLPAIGRLLGLAKQCLQVPEEDLPALQSYDHDLSWVVQWHQHLVHRWSTNPTQVPGPLQWWVDRVSSYRQIHLQAWRQIQHISTDADLTLLTLAFLEDSMGHAWVRRMLPGPWERHTWAYLDSMDMLRIAFFHHPSPDPVAGVQPMSTHAAVWIGGVLGALVILALSLVLVLRARRTPDHAEVVTKS